MSGIGDAIRAEGEALSSIFSELAADLKEASLSGPRARFCAASALSVGVATIVALAMHVDDVWWAAISAFMCSQASLPASLTKGVLRMIGTIVGALVALMLVSWLAYDWVACCLFLFMSTLIGTLGFQLSAHAYAWLLGSITFNFIILLALSSPQNTFYFSIYRIMEVAIGVGSALLIAALFSPKDGGATLSAAGWAGFLDDPQTMARLHALRAAFTVMLIPIVWSYAELPSLAQMAITISAVMAVPAPSAATPDPGLMMVRRALHRLLGCFLGGVIALVCLAAPLTNFVVWLATLMGGVWIGCHLQATPRKIGYVGTQGAIVFIMTLVQGFGPPTSIWPAVERLGGVSFGLVILLLVSIVFEILVPETTPPRLAVD
ncbi:FUSC family protein [Methylocella silvestris]|uniref:FUSC family protein n=1 Tax=Methylocella silvestris TaxID=199596 RepID=UPI0015E126CE|nr:FUSC family protein [Methylocella silvestris]